MKKIILASASPRRRELLANVGVIFQVCPGNSEERITKEIPEEIGIVITEGNGSCVKI